MSNVTRHLWRSIAVVAVLGLLLPSAQLATTGSGFVLDPPNAGVSVGAGTQPLSGNASVNVKPVSSSGDIYLRIGVHYGPEFVYHYRAQP